MLTQESKAKFSIGKKLETIAQGSHVNEPTIGELWADMLHNLKSLIFESRVLRQKRTKGNIEGLLPFRLTWDFDYVTADYIEPEMMKDAILYGFLKDKYRFLLESTLNSAGKEIQIKQIHKMKVDGVQGGSQSLPFNVSISLRGGRTASFCLNLSTKSSHNNNLRIEFYNFQHLYNLDPRFIVPVYTLTESHFWRERLDREIPLLMYSSKWLEGYRDIIFANRDNLAVNDDDSGSFSIIFTKRMMEQIYKARTIYYVKTGGCSIDRFCIGNGDVMWKVGGTPSDFLIVAARYLRKERSNDFIFTLLNTYEIRSPKDETEVIWAFQGSARFNIRLNRPFNVLNGVKLGLEDCYGVDEGKRVFKKWIREYLDGSYTPEDYKLALRSYLRHIDKPVEVDINGNPFKVESGTTIDQVIERKSLDPNDFDVCVSLHDKNGRMNSSYIVDGSDYNLPLMDFDNPRFQKKK